MLHQTSILLDVVRHLRTMFEINMQSMQAMCNYADKIIELALVQNAAVQEETRRFFKECIEHLKRARDEYFRLMNESFLDMQEYIKNMKRG